MGERKRAFFGMSFSFNSVTCLDVTVRGCLSILFRFSQIQTSRTYVCCYLEMFDWIEPPFCQQERFSGQLFFFIRTHFVFFLTDENSSLE